MNVNSVNGGSAVRTVYPTVRREIPNDGQTISTGNDQVQLSGQTPQTSGDIRADKVAEIRAQIANGTYETDDKLNATVDKMLDDVLS